MNELYPIFLKLKDRTAIVVGGGPVAGRRAARLVSCGARVTVISPEIVGDLEELYALEKIEWRRRAFQPADVEGAFLVFVATGDPSLVDEIRALSDRHGFLLNTAEDESRSDFHVPAVIEQNPVKVAVSTGGLSPGAAVKIRDALAGWMSLNAELVQSEVAAGRSSKSPHAGHERGERGEGGGRPHSKALPGWVHLVGGGPGNPELLTVRGHDLLTSADVVFYDRLISDAILGVIPKTTEKIYVGKEVGRANRANICRLLIEAARAHRAVVRLKGGDPLIFGRGGEEMLALRQAEIPFEVIPGVSALSAVPAAAHIPVTYRGVAGDVVVRSGHRLQHHRFHAGRRRQDETTYIYFMAMSRLEHVVKELLEEGVAASTPAAIVENGTLPEQRLITTELGRLVALANRETISAPALVVVGNVVLFRELKRFLPLVEAEAETETETESEAREESDASRRAQQAAQMQQ